MHGLISKINVLETLEEELSPAELDAVSKKINQLPEVHKIQSVWTYDGFSYVCSGCGYRDGLGTKFCPECGNEMMNGSDAEWIP